MYLKTSFVNQKKILLQTFLFCQDGNAFAREMLDERTKKAETWHHNAANRVAYSKPADPITCATFAQDVIEGRASVSQAHEHKHQPLIFGPASIVGGGLTSERERMTAQVFQPSYRYAACLRINAIFLKTDVYLVLYPGARQCLPFSMVCISANDNAISECGISAGYHNSFFY
jgi:hypothetical protein